MTRRWLSATDAAAYLGLPVSSLYRFAEEGRIACVRTDGRVMERQAADGQRERYVKSGRLRFLLADLDAWIDAHRAPATSDRRPARFPRRESAAIAADLPAPAKRRFS
jgi:excisionase family DNA binding protein